MLRRLRSNSWFFWLQLGVGLALICGSVFSSGAGDPTRTLLLVAGLAALFVGFIGLQLIFFAEGDLAQGQKEHLPFLGASSTAKTEVSVPKSLKNPTYRAIWKNITLSGRLLEEKTAEMGEKDHGRDKQWLGLPPDEKILLAGESKRLWTLPVAALSILCLAVSGTVTDSPSPHLSYFFLAFGLSGAILAFAGRRGVRYYLTNFRILVGSWRILCRTPSWQHIHYFEVREWQQSQSPFQTKLTIRGQAKQIVLGGIGKADAKRIDRILSGQAC